MKNLKLLAACLIATCASASAEDLYFYNEGNTQLVQSVKDVTKITFSENAIELTTGDGSTTSIDFAKFNYFQFTEENEGGVDGIEAAGNTRIAIDAAGLLKVASNAAIESIEVFNIQGAKLFEANPNATEFTQSLANTPKGIYIVRVVAGGSEKVQKIIK